MVDNVFTKSTRVRKPRALICRQSRDAAILQITAVTVPGRVPRHKSIRRLTKEHRLPRAIRSRPIHRSPRINRNCPSSSDSVPLAQKRKHTANEGILSRIASKHGTQELTNVCNNRLRTCMKIHEMIITRNIQFAYRVPRNIEHKKLP